MELHTLCMLGKRFILRVMSLNAGLGRSNLPFTRLVANTIAVIKLSDQKPFGYNV